MWAGGGLRARTSTFANASIGFGRSVLDCIALGMFFETHDGNLWNIRHFSKTVLFIKLQAFSASEVMEGLAKFFLKVLVTLCLKGSDFAITSDTDIATGTSRRNTLTTSDFQRWFGMPTPFGS